MFRLWRFVFALPLLLIWTCLHRVDTAMSAARHDMREPRAVYADTREPYVPRDAGSITYRDGSISMTIPLDEVNRPRQQVPGKPMLDPTPPGDRPW